jgi:hypothetical protein
MNLSTRTLYAIGGGLLMSSGLLALRNYQLGVASPSEQAYVGAISSTLLSQQLAFEDKTDLWQDHTTWDRAWIVQGKHFSVRTTSSRGLAQEVLDGQEGMRAYFDELLKGTANVASVCPIYIFPDRDTYNAFGDQHGQHHSSIMGGFYASGHPQRPIATYLDSSRTRTQMWITHNALHQYVSQNFSGTAPVWVTEGLASYFSLIWDFNYGIRELEILKDQDRLLPLEQLLTESLDEYPDDPHARFIQLGMMFNYLLRFNEDTMRVENASEALAPFDTFLRASARGASTAGLAFSLYLAEEKDAIVDGFLECNFQ